MQVLLFSVAFYIEISDVESGISTSTKLMTFTQLLLQNLVYNLKFQFVRFLV